MIFECNQCGICCKHINLIPELNIYDSGNGRCIHLLKNNLCDIYSNRPDICNVSKMYEKEYSKYMSEEEYLKINLNICKELKSMYQ